VDINNKTLLTVTMKIQQWFPSALLSEYKIFRTALNNINLLTSAWQRLVYFFAFNRTGIFSTYFHKISQKSVQ